jgi:hypothetical protein
VEVVFVDGDSQRLIPELARAASSGKEVIFYSGLLHKCFHFADPFASAFATRLLVICLAFASRLHLLCSLIARETPELALPKAAAETGCEC